MSIEFFIRILGMIVLGYAGIAFGAGISRLSGDDPYLSATVFGLVGALMGLVLTPLLTLQPLRWAKRKLTQTSAKSLFAGLVGLIIGLIVSALLAFPLSMLPAPYRQVLPIAMALVISYFCVVIFVARQGDIFYMWRNLSEGREMGIPGREDSSGNGRMLLLDTSVIIDGRVADIARTGFVPGEMVIPRFVLNELQHIADSGDNLRRQRGRRGLEVLAQMQKEPSYHVRISDIDVEGTRQVDDKLVILARQMRVPVLTNDYNLNRVAELQGVTILNINELANAVKAVFLPGEELVVRVIQEGREQGQGIGYLEDGTMIVVQDGNKFIGVELETVVTKVLQTAAGRMIFAKPLDE